MSKQGFNEAVENRDLELLLKNTKKACGSIIRTKGYYLPSHLDVEDIAQDAMIKLMRALETFDESKSTANTFCDRVINNLITDHVRRAVLESRHRSDYHSVIGNDSQSDDELGENNSTASYIPVDNRTEDEIYMKEILMSATKQLTERQMRVFVFRRMGYTRNEIADKLSVSLRTVAGDWKRVTQVLLDLIY